MTTSSRRVVLSSAGLAVLLIAGLLIARAAGDSNNSADGTLPTTPPPTTEQSPNPASPKEEVKDAYLRHWDVYLTAVRTLDTSRLDEVFTGRALAVVTKGVERRRRDGIPVRIRVEHDMAIKLIDATTAVVDDRYVNRAVELDPQTGKPTKRYPDELIHDVFTLKKVSGAWKVSAIVRQSVRPIER